MGDETVAEPPRREVAERTNHDPRLETIASFLARAFPEGTVPFPRYHDKDPTAGLHYAFNLTDWDEGNEVAILEARRDQGLLLSTWPLWPPDMFACGGNLDGTVWFLFADDLLRKGAKSADRSRPNV